MTKREYFDELDVDGTDFAEKAEQTDVDTNTSDIGDLEVNKANQTEVDTVQTSLSDHTDDTDNPHSTDASDVNALSTGGGTVNGDVNVSGQLSESDEGVATETWINNQDFGGGMYEPVTSVDDTDGTTPVDAQLTIPNPEAYQSYRVIGYLWGSNYSQGGGANVSMDINIAGNTDSIYDYTLLEEGTLTWNAEDTTWTDDFWQRYKHPIDYTFSADSDPVTADDGNDSMFITIQNNAQQGRRGLMNGRMAGGWADGGHPYATISSINFSTTWDAELKLVVYGTDWRSDV